MRAHPTYNEGIGEALEELEGGAIHVMPKKKNKSGSNSKGNRNCRKTWNVDFRVVIVAFFVYGVTVYNDYKQQ